MDKVQKSKVVGNFLKFTELVGPRKTKDYYKALCQFFTVPLIRWIQNWLSDFSPKVCLLGYCQPGGQAEACTLQPSLYKAKQML